MSYLPQEQSRRVFTIGFIKKYDELAAQEAPSFFSSFFKKQIYSTLGTSIKARRGSETIAVDVIRGSKGNLNQATQFTEKMFIPPYYNEKLNVSAMQIYDLPFESAEGAVNVAQVTALAEQTATEMYAIMQKILRAIEKQAAQVFETGIVTLENGDNIDFKRKASMKEVLTGADLWSSTSVDILGRFETVGQKLRRVGKITGGSRINAIMGMEAWQGFRKALQVTDGENFMTVNTLNVSPRMKLATGGAFMGVLKAGGNEFDIWVYDEVYYDESGVEQTYFNPKSVVWIPESFMGELSMCQVPKLPSWVNQMPAARGIMANRPPMSQGFDLSDYVDQENEEYIARTKVCPLAQPINVDTIYTAQVIADA